MGLTAAYSQKFIYAGMIAAALGVPVELKICDRYRVKTTGKVMAPMGSRNQRVVTRKSKL
jgi:hypothetical protein